MGRQTINMFVALVVLLGSGAPAFAAVIQIGSFDWDVVLAGDPDAVFCSSAASCARFTVTNDLGLLSSSQLTQVNLAGNEDFANTEITESPAVLGDIAVGASGVF